MSKNKILNDLAKERFVEKQSAKFYKQIGNFLYDDFTQHIYLQLLEMSDAYVVGLFNKNELGYFIRYIIKLNATSKSSRFQQKVKKLFTECQVEDEYLLDNLVNTEGNCFDIISADDILYYWNEMTETERLIIDGYDTKNQSQLALEHNVSQFWISTFLKKSRINLINKYREDND